MNQPDELILLVGSNPLPNYVAAAVVEPKKVHLVYSTETRDVMGRLKACLESTPLKVEVASPEQYEIGDATDVREIRQIADRLPKESGLHYTGGTKTMSAHILKAWHQRGGRDDWASYLDDRGNRLRFDSGNDEQLEGRCLIDLDTLSKMHGLEVKPRSSVPGGPEPGDAGAIARAVLANQSLAARLYDEVPAKKSDFKQRPLQPSAVGLQLQYAFIPAKDWSGNRVEAWLRFLRGDWLEEWIAATVRGIVPSNGGTVHVGVHATDGERSFELDVLVIRGYRLYVISCTTEHSDHHLCKAKLFEVAMRARQLGGDLARFAFVCLLDKDKEGNDWADTLEDQVGSAWDSSNKPRVFGLKHLCAWSGFGNAEPAMDDLAGWLKS